MLLKMMVSPTTWRYLLSALSLLTAGLYEWVVDVFYLAAEVGPGGDGS
jgi:hypothetical protein